MKLSPEERKEYEAYVDRIRKLASTQITEMEDVKDLIKEKVDETKQKAVLKLNKLGLEKEKIAIALDISIEKVNQIIKGYSQK